jgi:hypothetical protein
MQDREGGDGEQSQRTPARHAVAELGVCVVRVGLCSGAKDIWHGFYRVAVWGLDPDGCTTSCS